jgi:hypothetical protein
MIKVIIIILITAIIIIIIKIIDFPFVLFGPILQWFVLFEKDLTFVLAFCLYLLCVGL